MEYQISAILPVYNEADNLETLTKETREVFLKNSIHGEIIFIYMGKKAGLIFLRSSHVAQFDSDACDFMVKVAAWGG